MTHNQIDYARLKEERRHNTAGELETNRSNVAREAETYRHNIRSENQQDLVINETGRHNLATETETNRHNLVTEAQTDQQIKESKRHNVETEGANWLQAQSRLLQARSAQGTLVESSRHNAEMEAETNRHNMRTEQITSTGNLLNYESKYIQPLSKTAVDKATVSEKEASSSKQWMETLSKGVDIAIKAIPLFVK